MRSRLLLIASVFAACQHGEDRSGNPAPAAPAATPAPAPGSTAAQAVRPPAPPETPPLPGDRRDITELVGDAQRVAIGDLTGDGKAELVLAGPERLRVVDPSGHELASVPAPGGIQVLAVDHGRVLAGWGESREHRDAPARISAYRLEQGALVESVIEAPATTRAEVVAIVPAPDGALLVAWYASKYEVRAQLARQAGKGWKLSDVATIRMATSWAYADLAGDHHRELVVGRVYGDTLGADGDAFVLRADGTREPLPTVRGLRGMVVADTDGDGKDELFVADGWHQHYATDAHALIGWVHGKPGGGWLRDQLDDLAGEYSAGKLLAADLDGDGRPELISSGSHYVRVLVRDGNRWNGATVATVARDVAAGDLDGVPGAELVILGAKSEIVRLK